MKNVNTRLKTKKNSRRLSITTGNYDTNIDLVNKNKKFPVKI